MQVGESSALQRFLQRVTLMSDAPDVQDNAEGCNGQTPPRVLLATIHKAKVGQARKL